MTGRRVLVGVIGVLAGVVVVLTGVLAWVLLRPQTSTIALVVADSGSNLRVIESGKQERVLSTDYLPAQYRFPAVSPDRQTIAYIGGSNGERVLATVNVRTGERRELFRSVAAEPFDLAWSPDNQYLLFLTPTERGLTLYVVPADGAAEAQAIATGRSVYFSWTPDAQHLVLHIDDHTALGGRLALYRVGDETPTELLDDPGFFQAPAFSTDGGSIFYVAQPPLKQPQLTYDEIEAAVVRVGTNGADPQVLAREPRAGIRLVRAPTTDLLAYTVQQFEEDGTFEWGALKLVDGTGGEVRVLSRTEERVAAFFWSPDGKQVAYLSYVGPYTSANGLTWHIVDTDTSVVRDLATFTPSQSFSQLVVFFDAYQHGLSPWSPDGTRLAYGTNDGVYVVDVVSGNPARAGDGAIAVWAEGIR
jgi:TolB protein